MGSNLRCLTPWITRVVGSSRFKLPSDFFSKVVLFAVVSSGSTEVFFSDVVTAELDFEPMLHASYRSNPMAGRKMRRAQYLTRFLTTRRTNSFLNRWPSFLRFLRTRTRILPSSSDSSSETEMDMLLLLNIWLIAEIVKERLELGSEIWVNYGFLSSFFLECTDEIGDGRRSDFLWDFILFLFLLSNVCFFVM